MKPKTKFMDLAIKEAGKNLKTMDGGPFGACIVKGSRVLAVSRNMVLKKDATCHAEINAIRIASKKLKTFDLSGCKIYSTNEPCPMCFGAIHWAGIDSIIFGTKVSDAKRIGFNELDLTNADMKKRGKSKVRIFQGFMRKECKKLLEDWDKLEYKIIY